MTKKVHIYDKEAKKISAYLINKNISSDLVDLYKESLLKKLEITKITDSEKTLWSIALMHTLFLDSIDNALRFYNSYSPIRARIYIMACILECQPTYINYFLIEKKTILDLLKLFIEFILYPFKLALGFFLILIFHNNG